MILLRPKKRTRNKSSSGVFQVSQGKRFPCHYYYLTQTKAQQQSNDDDDDNTQATTNALEVPTTTKLPQKPQKKAKKKQTIDRRRIPNNKRGRKPRHYWSNVDNFKLELCQFWEEVLCLKDSYSKNYQVLWIPNEALLNYFDRHDLRGAIQYQGGRPLVCRKLNQHQRQLQQQVQQQQQQQQARIIILQVGIMPGRWKDAVRICPQLKQLILLQQQQEQQEGGNSRLSSGQRLPLSLDDPPLSPQQLKQKQQQQQQRPSSKEVEQQQSLSSNVTTKNDKEKKTKKKNQSVSKSNTPTSSSSNKMKWSHSANRKPKGYWSIQLLIQELYEYLDHYRLEYNRPSTWMPRLSELTSNGRKDLHQAIVRYGGYKRIGQVAGLVPHREWSYFEGQYELISELKRYFLEEQERQDLKEDEDGWVVSSAKGSVDETTKSGEDDSSDDATTTPRARRRIIPKTTMVSFPCVSEIRRSEGYEQLYKLIQYHGGRKFIASRLGMKCYHNIPKDNNNNDEEEDEEEGTKAAMIAASISTKVIVNEYYYCYGPTLDLDFILRLLQWIRDNHYYSKSPPLRNPVIGMPTKQQLLFFSSSTVYCYETNDTQEQMQKKQQDSRKLHEEIMMYGGYESIARRLGLFF